MEPTQDNYPVFEANQVLSYSHLNQLFNYLDEQERLTRANLIGIGVVCGLEIRVDPNESPETIHLSRGCGVTSQGYLIVEPDDVALVAYRPYTLPTETDYPQFKDASAVQYPLWELFPAGEPDTTPLGTPAGFPADKAVLLFLELKKEGLRNCCANNCDDQGSAVTVTLRRLLITRTDLDQIIEAASELTPALTSGGLSDALAAELGLQEIRLPRYDVPAGSLASSIEVLAAFQAVFPADKLVEKTAAVLSAAYQAFKPLLAERYPDDPFVNSFSAKFGFLDTVPQTQAQVRFLQYYYDLFDDLFKAYDELRRRGVGLMCVCTPPDGLFPRHLMLGVPASYRHHFLASPATGRCGAYADELKQLFQRLVELAATFSETPSVPESPSDQIRITPSKLWDVPLSEKAIPYYYRPDGTPPLHTLWNVEKSRRNRANQNLGYHSDRYTPPAPGFVTKALQYDLEPYNFLRVEGHLGRDYRAVLRALLLLKNRYRLPIEILALRAGAFDERIPVDLSKESCRFQDLEALYDSWKSQLACFLCKEVRYFYQLPEESGGPTVPAAPGLPMLLECAPGFLVQPNTLGRLFEEWLARVPGRNLAAIDLNLDLRFVGRFNVLLFLIAYLARLYDALAKDLTGVDFPELEKRYQELVRLTEVIENQREQGAGTIDGNVELLKWEELDDRLEAIIYNCRLDVFKALRAEYERRIKEVKQKQFLSFFLQNHPGVQHKAGVPLGGTFVLVYHETPAPVRPPRGVLDLSDLGLDRLSLTRNRPLSAALDRLAAKPTLLADPDLRIVFGELTGEIPRPPLFPGGLDPETGGIYAETVRAMADGTVIADFFLPYLCCSDCAPVQFVLPAPPLGLTVQLACTSAETGSAEATVTPQGGSAPYSYQIDDQPFTELGGAIVLAAGSHKLQIRDSAGSESKLQSINVPRALAVADVRFTDDASSNSYRVTFTISGGTAPYQADSGAVTGNVFTGNPVTGGATISVTVTDKAGCQITREFQHSVCALPCGGQSRRCNYRLWIQPPSENELYETYRQGEMRFRFNGEPIQLPPDLLQFEAVQLNTDFENGIAAAVKRLNAAVNAALIQRLGEAGRDRLLVSYEPAAVDPFRSIRIEYFVCDTFAIEFDYNYGQPSPSFSLTMRYGNEPSASGAPFDGALLVNRRLNEQTMVPVFDCSERNQCDGSDYRKLCEGFNPQPVITVERLQDDNQIRFQFTGSVVDTSQRIAAWVWDVFATRSTEPYYEGEKVVAQLERPVGEVRLTVITEKGCFSAVDQRIIIIL
ncbi:MAG: hypothetical protein A2075_00170 [Geobacteraceae bacterium GWC2_58_44]|nr:MAG: hypothetical protein A2075_00170 [Geobacteraceae bacterium GWC2_58_44]HBG06525.1 hypothetical protein [Geobacter sp.]